MPPGIAKKFAGFFVPSTATTTPPPFIPSLADKEPPELQNVTAYINSDAVQIRWQTNEVTTAEVQYSSRPFQDPQSTIHSVRDDTPSLSHILTATNLSENTTYYFLILAKDERGNRTGSKPFTLITGTPVTFPVTATTTADVIPPNIGVLSTTVGTSTIRLTVPTSEQTTATLLWSGATPINIASASRIGSSLSESHAFTLSNLATGTPYHLLLEAKDAAGNRTRTEEFSLSTLVGI